MLHPRSNRQSPSIATLHSHQNQSPTSPIRNKRNLHKTNTRIPNQSQTFAHFASRVHCGTSDFAQSDSPLPHRLLGISRGTRLREFLSGTDPHSTRAHLHETKRENIF